MVSVGGEGVGGAECFCLVTTILDIRDSQVINTELSGGINNWNTLMWLSIVTKIWTKKCGRIAKNFLGELMVIFSKERDGSFELGLKAG